MFEKLKLITNQYEEKLQRLELPETYSDPSLYARLDREARELAPLVEAYRGYTAACSDMDAALGLTQDPELRDLAQEEYAAAKKRRQSFCSVKPLVRRVVQRSLSDEEGRKTPFAVYSRCGLPTAQRTAKGGHSGWD